MPKRRIPHRQGGAVQATFYVVCEDPARLVPSYAQDMIGCALEALEARAPTRCCAIVERPPRLSAELPDVARPGLPTCRAAYADLAGVERALAEKREHAKPEYRQPGHVSYVPPEMLTAEGLVVIIGSRRFLGTNIVLYLEERGRLRKEVIPTLLEICGLRTASSREPGRKCDFPIGVREGKFDPYYFNMLWEQIMLRRRDTAAVAELLGTLE
ncbi:MAG: hypothetical protein KGI78_03420 [Patescibacteria group bacterium]|nr:hypothetical protein [Patescibacteria group bacterium]MDE1944309.1 hypothetical protein [Patescibacteria group bacterium]MDE1945300.1 hypothetical protein [Patescibacteria group bacterium]MDE2057877.1 hypothetical protein [Patescibacteria group bacterium]